MSICNGDTNCEDACTVKSIESTILENFSELTKEEIDIFIDSLNLNYEKTKELKNLSINTYIGKQSNYNSFRYTWC